jgi:phosphate-selective porin OprO/OprP
VLKNRHGSRASGVHSSMWKGLTSFSLFSACLWAQGPFQIHGYIQGRFTNQEGTPDRLEIRRARLSISGNALPKLSYTFQGDVAKRPYLMDAALTWKFARALSLTAGQFKIPFSAESLISDHLNIPIARARAVNALAPGRDTGVQARDVGLELAGTLGRRNSPVLEYAAGVFRGQTFVDAPNVHYAAIIMRVLVHPAKGWALGGDWYASFSAPAKAEKRREEVEGGFQHGSLQLRAEQIWARDGMLERHGGYVLAAKRLSKCWEPLARADWLTTDTHKMNTTSVAYLGGLNFYWGKHVKVGVNAGTQHDQGPKGFSSLVLVQTMLGF